MAYNSFFTSYYKNSEKEMNVSIFNHFVWSFNEWPSILTSLSDLSIKEEWKSKADNILLCRVIISLKRAIYNTYSLKCSHNCSKITKWIQA